MKSAFASWHDFWLMGGYAYYVWLAVAVTLVAVLALVLHTVLQRRALLADVRRQASRERRIRAARQMHKPEEA